MINNIIHVIYVNSLIDDPNDVYTDVGFEDGFGKYEISKTVFPEGVTTTLDQTQRRSENPNAFFADYKDYDIVILPQNMIRNFEDKSIDLVLNTSSLSEMKNETQDFYLSQIERVTKKYFYSVNRHKYKMHKYNAQGFYNLKFKKRWNTIIYDFTHTFQLEFLGKVEE